jgi:hypothetical protein
MNLARTATTLALWNGLDRITKQTYGIPQKEGFVEDDPLP